MTAAALVRELADAGISLASHGNNLRVTAAPGTLTRERCALLVAHKAELLAALRAEAAARVGHPLTLRERRAVVDAYRELRRTLDANPDRPRAVRTVEQPEGAPYVLLAVAVRGAGCCTLRVPRERYDGIKVLEMLERRSAPRPAARAAIRGN